MRNTIYILFAVVILVSINSCDKIKYPTKIVTELDTTLYTGGVWAEYPTPVFETNSNNLRNVLLEDYTGHKCPNCPNAASVANDIEKSNPERVYVVSVHTGPGGDGSFQDISSDCSNPDNDYCYDFRTTESNNYGETFSSGFGFIGNPQGTINRITFGSDMFSFSSNWSNYTTQTLTENDLKINMQSQSNYYDDSRGMFLHVETEFLDDLAGDYNIVTYVIKNEIIEDQDSSGVHIHKYHHHNVFLGCIDELAFGQPVGQTNPSSGSKIITDYSYKLPTNIEPSEIHFLTYVYNVETYEIMQVIKHEI